MIISAAERTGHIKEYYFSGKLKEIEAMRAAGRDIINLGIGNPDMPPSQQVLDAAMEKLAEPGFHGYQSYRGTPAFRKSISGWYKRFYHVELDPATEILPLMGSKEGIFHISMAFLNPGDQALVPNPGYPAYASVTRMLGADVIPYELSEDTEWFPNLLELEQHDLSGVKIMWVNYPHMPSGAIPTRKLYQDLVAFAKRNEILLCLDNPYSFILNDEPLSILSVDGAKDVALELNSLSKSHNMAGWRLGMLSGNEEYLTEVMKIVSNIQSGMFRVLQEAATEALTLPDSWYEELNEEYRSRSIVARGIFDVFGCTYSSEQAGLFVWARIPDSENNAYDLSDRILEKAAVFITPGGIFGSRGQRYLRLSICSDKDVLMEAKNRIINIL